MEKSFLKDPICQLAIRFSVLILLTSFFFLLLFWPKLPPEVPLFYSSPWGNEQLAPRLLLFISPTYSLSVVIFNLILASFVKEKLLIRTVSWVATLSSFLLAFTLIKIIFLIA